MMLSMKDFCGDGVEDRPTQHDLSSERRRSAGVTRSHHQIRHHSKWRTSDRIRFSNRRRRIQSRSFVESDELIFHFNFKRRFNYLFISNCACVCRFRRPLPKAVIASKWKVMTLYIRKRPFSSRKVRWNFYLIFCPSSSRPTVNSSATEWKVKI